RSGKVNAISMRRRICGEDITQVIFSVRGFKDSNEIRGFLLVEETCQAQHPGQSLYRAVSLEVLAKLFLRSPELLQRAIIYQPIMMGLALAGLHADRRRKLGEGVSGVN